MDVTPRERNDRCSIARSLQVLGEKWSLLVVREAVLGVTRFADFRARLGVAPDVLAARLETLVEGGVLERRPYRDAGQRQRDEYVLTPMGMELQPVLAAFVAWGDEHRPSGFGPSIVYVDKETSKPVRLAFLADDGRELGVDDVTVVAGPGAPVAA
ncbi:winged helix-turn-helix transcriptional regulator [Promicromonospora thailandica]|uniref:Transcriptional regulator, HxlR family n=1 Tax=Promicromonospora thailandica TaxID=765201 RepID=A0A9X2G6F5_9MICO|nr:helix-turn-helix domain-containing protein [Promicromonospora thailandica]MCP2266588.1 transcriptional regulator, HxlR family [Promicromonospora thailandica]BFF17337.1 helix-turn-helix domain-containing protein [Promicromonospora thailandica]